MKSESKILLYLHNKCSFDIISCKHDQYSNKIDFQSVPLGTYIKPILQTGRCIIGFFDSKYGEFAIIKKMKRSIMVRSGIMSLCINNVFSMGVTCSRFDRSKRPTSKFYLPFSLKLRGRGDELVFLPRFTLSEQLSNN